MELFKSLRGFPKCLFYNKMKTEGVEAFWPPQLTFLLSSHEPLGFRAETSPRQVPFFLILEEGEAPRLAEEG